MFVFVYFVKGLNFPCYRKVNLFLFGIQIKKSTKNLHKIVQCFQTPITVTYRCLMKVKNLSKNGIIMLKKWKIMPLLYCGIFVSVLQLLTLLMCTLK